MSDQPQSTQAQPAAKAATQQQARNNAVAAVKALSAPEPSAETPPPATNPSEQPASGEGSLPRVEPVQAKAPPATEPVESEPAPEPAGPPEKTWERLHQVETELAARKKELEAETKALEAQKDLLATGQNLDQRLRQDPLALAQEYGWSDQQLAQILVARNQDGFAPQPARAPQAAPVYAPQEPAPSKFDVKPEDSGPSEDDKLNFLTNAVVELKWENELLRNPEFEVLRSMPDALQYAIQAAADHYSNTGGNLTPAEGLAIAQERLIAEKKKEIELIRGNPTLSSALGLDRSSRTFDGLDASDASSDGDPEQMTSITNTTTGTPPQPGQPQPANLSHEERLKRAMEAMRRAREVR